MKKDFSRRSLIQFTVAGAITLYFQKLFAAGKLVASDYALSPFVLANKDSNPGNFYTVYKNPQLKEEFFLFLKNVYNIYPEKEFHSFISDLVDKNKSDEEIYRAILANLSTVKPFLSEISYAIPALAHQKQELAAETMEFLKDKKSINGYLEIGTTGRYISELKKHIDISGDIALINVTEPTYSPADILERGQLFKLGRYMPLNNYAPLSPALAPENSFDVVTNYIGFHHSSLEQLNEFVTSIVKVIKPGGTFILRDHDVINEKMNHMVSLAHDVFNAGLKQTWEYNHEEIRNFRPLSEWISYLKDRGLVFKGRQILQPGDPTKNALMEFVKV